MYTLTKTITQHSVTYIVAMLIFLGAAGAWAGEITTVNWFSGVASVAGETVYSPTAPNNDNMSGPSPKTISLPLTE